MKSFRMFITEGSPLRIINPDVKQWLESHAKDAKTLYLHGSPYEFSRFKQPKLDYGHLIFFSSLNGRDGLSRPLQAEYYGHHLYLCKLDKGKSFDVRNDPKARTLYEEFLGTGDVWDRERKLASGRVDYQDLHLVVPGAVKAGYTHFRVYEMAVQDYSDGVAYPRQVQIVDTFPK
jgi:hypothetical protein